MRHFATMRFIIRALFILLLSAFAAQSVLANDDLQVLRQAAEADQSAKAQYRLGLRYLQGKGVNQDSRSALMWLQRAAEQNYAPAQYQLGELYRTGDGVDIDAAAAVEYLTSAAEQGYPTAQYKLGTLYLTGNLVEKDLIAATEWMELASEHGYTEAKQILAELNKAALTTNDTIAAQTEDNTREASTTPLNTHIRAAERGDAKAQYQLGEIYRKGTEKGVSRSFKEAAKWYGMAAEQGNAEAQYQLGEFYSKGRGVKKNKKIARKWYKAAAEQGHLKAKYQQRGCGFC
ncbi:MAG: sel1 repeat family protein [Gammaproteobacteria bacterium]|nr:sel1 repeat family protein [Gammaproteobacteria bacterium]MCF6362990.1 sel1 repeat family protein [Gammaproteobacteria bacterium]